MLKNVKVLKLNQNEIKVFKYLLIYAGLFVFPIILANVYYVDDIGRSIDGDAAWKGDGRPVMLIMARIFSNGGKLMPVFPLPLIFAIFLLTYSVILLSRRFSLPNKPIFKASILAFSFVNLFLLENFSYSYEAFGMTLALCLFIAPFVLYDMPNSKKYFCVTFLITIFSMSTYQAAVGAYLSLAIIENTYLLKRYISLKTAFINLIYRLMPLLLGVVIYKVTIAKALVKAYAGEHAGTISLLSKNGINQLGINFMGFLDMWKLYFETLGPVLSVGVILIIVLSAYFMIREYWEKNNVINSWKNKIACILIAITPLFIAIASIFPFLFLQNPVYAPRVFLSFTIFTLYLGVLLYYIGQHCKYMLVFLPLFLLFNLSFASAYGMALNREDKHDAQIAQYIVYDLNQIEQQRDTKFEKISIIGSEPKAKEVILLNRKKPLMGRLIPGYMTTDWYWGGAYLRHYRVGKITNEKLTNEDKAVVTSSASLKTNEYYQIYINEDKALIVFPSVSKE